jgi:hypothetical protein
LVLGKSDVLAVSQLGTLDLDAGSKRQTQFRVVWLRFRHTAAVAGESHSSHVVCREMSQ